MRPLVSLCIVAALAGCAGAPTLRDADKSGVYGYLRLRPHQGASAGPTAGAPSDAYGDRRYSGADLVDYSKPGFAVIYLEGGGEGTRPAAPDLAIRPRAGGVVIEPAYAAVALGGEITLQNLDDRPRIVSVPAAGLVRALAPGDRLLLPVTEVGALEIFVPDSRDAAATLFVAPGPFATVSESGRFEILEVAPGPNRLRVWHPRLPPTLHGIAFEAGRVLRLDLEIGVGRGNVADAK